MTKEEVLIIEDKGLFSSNRIELRGKERIEAYKKEIELDHKEHMEFIVTGLVLLVRIVPLVIAIALLLIYLFRFITS